MPSTLNTKYKIQNTKEDVKKYGLRNSLLLASMPTASCQLGSNKIQMADGSNKSLYEIMEENKIDFKSIEHIDQQISIGFEKSIKVNTKDGVQSSPGIHYNGFKDVYDIEFEDGAIYSFTENHMLFVTTGEGSGTWKQVKDLSEEDNIIVLQS